MIQRVRDTTDLQKTAILHMQLPELKNLQSELLKLDSSCASIAYRMGTITFHTYNNAFSNRQKTSISFCGDSDNKEALCEEFRSAIINNEIRTEKTFKQMTDQNKAYWNDVKHDLLSKIDKRLEQHITDIEQLDFNNCVNVDRNYAIEVIISSENPTQYCQSLIALDLVKVDFYTRMLLDLNKATLRCSYQVNNDFLIITAWLKKDSVETMYQVWHTPKHSSPLTTDDAIFNLWFGGRYIRGDCDKLHINYNWESGNSPASGNFPVNVMHKGLYQGPFSAPSIAAKLQHQNAMLNEIKKYKQSGLKTFIDSLSNGTTAVGKLTNRLNMLCTLLTIHCIFHQGTLQPNKDLTSSNHLIQNGNHLRDLITHSPDDIDQSFERTLAVCNNAINFTDDQHFLKFQNELKQKLLSFKQECARAPINPINPQESAQIAFLQKELSDLKKQNELILTLLKKQTNTTP